jgi:hypothetical protein
MGLSDEYWQVLQNSVAELHRVLTPAPIFIFEIT